MSTSQQGSSFRIHPILLILIGMVVLAIFVGAGILIGRGSASSAPVAQEGSSSPTSSPSSTTPSTEQASPSSARISCPAPKRLTTEPFKKGQSYAIDSPYMKDRAFDFLEAYIIAHPQKMLDAMRTKGDPPGLLSKQLLAQVTREVESAPSGDEIPGADVTLVLDRQASIFDPSIEESSDDVRFISLRAVFNRCRDGYLIGKPVVPVVNTDDDPVQTTWIFENGAWRVTT